MQQWSRERVTILPYTSTA